MSDGAPRPIVLGQLAVLPTAADNAAIATREIAAGTPVPGPGGGEPIVLAHAVLEGHRFAIRPVAAGAPLLSWGLPFGYAVSDIAAGDYLCTPRMLEVLRGRRPDLDWPAEPNFENRPLDPYLLDETSFSPAGQLDPVTTPGTFLGYDRGPGRIAGTRNHIVVLGATARTGPFAESLAARFGDAGLPDPVVAVAHTEGAESETPNNLEFLRRTLAGFCRNPNVGALLILDEPGSPVDAESLEEYAAATGLPPITVPVAVAHQGDDLDAAAAIITGWLPEIRAARRVERPLSDLLIGLQCGGSDAFSGVSANPLIGSISAELIRHGGTAVLAETDELIGAESYVLDRVRDAGTARRFLATVESFSGRVRAHGHTAEGNVSGGNIMRGLYNISLKSLGAARKRDPRVRLDHVIDYGEPLPGPGYIFMDSPGNDLESVAGQVASGCNLIFFTTGNGSITNFPFVPTLKFVSTSGRYRLLTAEMDVNAGEILDGTPLEDVTRTAFDLTVRAASGERTAGERAGHSQVSIWRNWQQSGTEATPLVLSLGARPNPELPGIPLPVGAEHARPADRWDAVSGVAVDRIGLVMPTSICAGQVALQICTRLTERFGSDVVSRFVALPHTEGCGATSAASEDIWARTATGYVQHPSVGAALLLEHGCEITHNDFFRQRLGGADAATATRSLDRYGWASIQLDGGIELVAERVANWFAERLDALPPWDSTPVGLDRLSLGLHAEGEIDEPAGQAYAELAAAVAATGGTVVVPASSGLWRSAAFRLALGIENVDDVEPTIAHAQHAPAGLHVMQTPTDNWLEIATGLGSAGVGLIATHVSGQAVPAHRFVPVLQTATGSIADVDLDLSAETDVVTALRDKVLATASRAHTPILTGRGVVGFQVSRGLLGVSV